MKYAAGVPDAYFLQFRQSFQSLIETFREATEKLDLKAGYAFSESVLHHYGLTGAEPYICPVKPQIIQVAAPHPVRR